MITEEEMFLTSGLMLYDSPGVISFKTRKKKRNNGYSASGTGIFYPC